LFRENLSRNNVGTVLVGRKKNKASRVNGSDRGIVILSFLSQTTEAEVSRCVDVDKPARGLAYQHTGKLTRSGSFLLRLPSVASKERRRVSPCLCGELFRLRIGRSRIVHYATGPSHPGQIWFPYNRDPNRKSYRPGRLEDHRAR